MDSTGSKDTKTKTLSSKCLGIVFKEKKLKTHSLKTTEDASKPPTAKIASPEQLFKAFTEENSRCHWNPHLEESFKNLKYEGHVHPHTLLVAGRDIYLDTIKNAWARRAIRSPTGYTVHKLGEVPGVEMTVIPQTQFTPLPEALCISIAELTKGSKDASFDAILDHLRVTYRGLQVPSETVVYETLGNLIKDRSIYHTGNGYHILTPDLHQPGSNAITVQDQHLVIGGGDTANGFTPTLYIPLMNPAANGNDMVSISCQTETSPTSSSGNHGNERSLSGNRGDEERRLERSLSVRESRKSGRKDAKDPLQRAGSVRGGTLEEKVKDINLKTSDVHQDKDKGEKTTLLGKLLRRHKPAPREAAPSVATGEVPVEAESARAGPPPEYVTFSAQFPPPEWQWYEGQVAKIVQPVTASSPHYHGPPPRHNNHHGNGPAHSGHHGDGQQHTGHQGDGDTEIDELYDEIRVHARTCPVSRARLAPDELDKSNSQDVTVPKVPHSCSSYSDTWSSVSDLPVKPPLNYGSKPPHGRPRHREQPRNRSHDRHSYPQSPRDNSNLHPEPVGQYQSTSDYEDLPSLPPQHQLPNPYPQPDPTTPAPAPVPTAERPSHVTKVFKKYRQMKCPGGSVASNQGNDITVEYCGRLPRKHGAVSMSRDSGVNCIGLGNGQNRTGKSAPKLFGENQYNMDTSEVAPVSAGDGKPSNLHCAQVHPQPSPEDSGFNSPHVYQPGAADRHSFEHPNASTPKNLTNYNNNQLREFRTDEMWETALDGPDHHGNQHLNNQNPAVEPRKARIQTSEGSINNLWSDTSEQTVRENKTGLSQNNNVQQQQQQQQQQQHSQHHQHQPPPHQHHNQQHHQSQQQQLSQQHQHHDRHHSPDTSPQSQTSQYTPPDHHRHHSADTSPHSSLPQHTSPPSDDPAHHPHHANHAPHPLHPDHHAAPHPHHPDNHPAPHPHHPDHHPDPVPRHKSSVRSKPRRSTDKDRHRSKPTPTRHRPADDRRRTPNAGRCPTRNYPTDNNNHGQMRGHTANNRHYTANGHPPNNHHSVNGHQLHYDSDESSEYQRKDYSVVGVI